MRGSDPTGLPSITIVTPCFNSVATIQGTLDSVRAQKYPGLQHVVVDGGSTDGTVQILQRAEGISYLSEPDRGRVDACNKGVGLAEGEVIGWLNADDTYLPGTLAAVGEAFAGPTRPKWVTGYCRIVDGAGTEIRAGVTRYKNFFLRHYSFNLYLTQNFISDPATFVRRDVLDRTGLLSEEYQISHDYDLWLRVAAEGDPTILPRYLSTFAMVDGTLSMSSFERQFTEHHRIARIRGVGHPIPVAVNVLTSRLIVLAYRAMRYLRGRRTSTSDA